ncbi:MAG: DUF4179 domain-containing protein [Psychrobacillus sp.]
MQKNLFNSITNDIEVPREDMMRAIEKGIDRGEKFRTRNKRTSIIKRTSIFTSAAAVMLLSSGFIFSPVTHVLAQMPLIGGIYENYQMQIGQELASDQLISEIKETAQDNGVEMTISSIFYDGSYVGITFKATGEALSDTIGGEKGPESGFTYEMFDGKDTSTWPGAMGSLTKEGDGYMGALILENPNNNAESSLNLPITFTHIAGVYGEWSFNLSAERLPSKQYAIGQTVTSEDGKYQIEFKSINVGETNAILSYTILNTAQIEGEVFNLDVYGADGDKLSLNSLSDSNVIFEVSSENTGQLITVEPSFKIGDEEIQLDKLKINLE